MDTLSPTQTAFIVGTLLGDGFLEKNGRHVRLRIDHGEQQRDFVLWKYQQLDGWTTGQPKDVTYYHKKHGRTYTNVRFSTRTVPAFDMFWDMFYPHGKKIVPKHINTLLTHLSVAVWLMDDGYKRNDCNAFRFNTDMFCKADQELLCAVLRQLFDLDCRLHRKGKFWNIYVPCASAKKLVELVKPYIIPSMRYKIGSV
jgi:hypothetical protein